MSNAQLETGRSGLQDVRVTQAPSSGSQGDPGWKSLWLEEAVADGFERAPALSGSTRADVCVVGGGFTGLWTALRLKELEPSIDVALVEADVCGSGASGRNGGFVLTWWSKFITLAKLCGPDEAVRLAQASERAVLDIGRFCEERGIDAGFRLDGWAWTATNRAQLDAWSATLDALDRAGHHPLVDMGPEETAKRTGSPVHLAGALEAVSAIVQPARLAMGLRREALGRGIRIFEGSPMVALDGPASPGESGATVRTAAGSVSAEKAVLAMNAWAVRLPPVRRHILVVASDIVATPPIPDRLDEIGWTDGLCISDSRLLVHYYRTTHDGRIAFGKGGGRLAFWGSVGPAFDGVSARRDRVGEAFRTTYPMLADVPLVRSWTGPIDRSRDGLPYFGPLEGHPSVLLGVGYSGNGVGPSAVGGRILASLALDRDDEWSGCGLVGRALQGFPPEPFREVGGLMVRTAIERKERAEDRSRRPGLISKLLVRLAPAGLVPVRRG